MKEKSKNALNTAKKSKCDFRGALVKKALGYDYKEVVEEYVSGEDGEVKLTKKKVTKKNVPPDITAIKILLEETPPLSDMTDEELQEEKQRLLKLLENLDLKENK
ncbi:MAG: hypothetical protein IJA88_00685 [Clostridia bacterium]|nr:hypothetical protein [Clostridia bacterium]